MTGDRQTTGEEKPGDRPSGMPGILLRRGLESRIVSRVDGSYPPGKKVDPGAI
jgi:hypothetical protein